MRQSIDRILLNANVYLIDPDFGSAECLAIDHGRILGAGRLRDLEERFRWKEAIDAGGRWVFPGFIDPHSHIFSYGYTLQMADLVGTSSWLETVERVRKHHERHPAAWILGRGWDQNNWEVKAFPTRRELDAAFPDRPVFLTRIDGHAAVANSAALRLAGIDASSSIEGGEFVREGGQLTGVLIDNAIEVMKKALPQPDRKARERALGVAERNCFSVGLTTVCDAGTDLDDILLLDSMHKDGSLKIRVYAMLNPTPNNFDHFLAAGPQASERLTVRSIKLYADGALGSRGALLLEPYDDAPDHRGLQLDSSARIDEICGKAMAAGFQVCTHCIGDAGVRLTLDLYERHLQPGNDLRWRIEHAQIVNPVDLPRFGRSRVIPSIQAISAISDMGWAGDRIGKRLRHAYASQALLRQNGWLANGSDFPIESINPVLGFHAAVARKDRAGLPEGGFLPDNALSREQAMRAMTIWAARANFEDHERGSLETGKWADFVILDRDLMTVPEDQIPEARVLGTYVAGESVHQAEY